MRKTSTLFLTFFLALSIGLFAQEVSKDHSQAPQNFNNPESVYGPPASGPAGVLAESFEDPTFPPAGWVKYSPDGGTGWERQTVGTTPIPGWTGGTVTAPPGGGDAVAFCTWTTGGASSNEQWLVSTQVTNVQTDDSLKFWIRKFSDLYADNVDILISTTDQQMASFTITVDNIVYAAADTGWVQYGYNLTDFVNSGDNIYIAFVEHVADNFNDGAAIFVDLVTVEETAIPVIPISQAIEDLDMDYIPDHLGEIVTVQGVVFSPNYQTSNNSFYISDGTAGTDIFMYAPPLYTWEMGDMLQITGEVTQYNGMTEIVPADSNGWVFLSSGNPTPDPIVLTLAEYKANPEMYEGSLVGFVSLSLVGGTWPASGSANIDLSDGQDTVTFRIDSDTDIDGQPEPTWPQDVLGIGSQYDGSAPYNSGYQIFPRYYASDFLPPGTIPVELTSFTVAVNDNSVLLNWNTATETNNKGFEIQRNSGNGFTTISFMPGQGTTTQPHAYSYTDQNLSAGHYSYRLKQVDFQGTYSFSAEVGVDVNSVSGYALDQNYPNPFNPGTVINFNLKVDSKVTLKVFNVLGQEVAQLLNGAITAGSHRVDFNASLLNSGVYFYRLEATGIDGSTFTSVKKMMLTK